MPAPQSVIDLVRRFESPQTISSKYSQLTKEHNHARYH